MTERKRGQTVWFNVYEHESGLRRQDKVAFRTREAAERISRDRCFNKAWKVLYRVCVRVKK